MFDRETPAGYARLLYTQAKAARDDLKKRGYNMEETYFVMVSAVVRLAMEDGGDAKLREIAEMLLEELAHSKDLTEGKLSEPVAALLNITKEGEKPR